jgi:autotransporter-associated beta strand protein
VTFGGVISGTGALAQAGSGTLILTGNNTYTGGTTISTGTLQVGNGGTTGDLLGNVTDNGTLTFDRSGAKKTFAGVVSGSGSLIKLGSDTVELTADNTYSGGTFITSGVLVAGVPVAGQATSFALGTGDVNLLGGTLRTPSLDPLVINVGGNYTQGPGGTLALGVAGTAGSAYDHVQAAGRASLGGTLAVSSLAGFHPVAGNAFGVLASGGARTGQFATVDDFLNNNPNLQRVERLFAQRGDPGLRSGGNASAAARAHSDTHPYSGTATYPEANADPSGPGSEPDSEPEISGYRRHPRTGSPGSARSADTS